MRSSGKRCASTGRLLVLGAVLILGSFTFAPSPAAAEEWVKNDMGKGYDANAQGGLYGVALGDGDRDGKIEVYASCYDNGHIYEYRCEGQKWTVRDLGVLWPGRSPRADAILVGDGDDDGKTEVYASGYMYTTGSLINSVYQLVNGTGGWTKADIGASGGWGMDLAMGDGDRDGRVELYSGDADGHIYQYSKINTWNIQDIGASPQFHYNNNWFNPYMRGVEVGDADNDGKVEVYGASSDGHVYRFNCTGAGWERTDLGVGENYSFPLYGLLGLTIGDADNDGRNEIYASSYFNATLWRYRHDPESGSWNLSKVVSLVSGGTANDLSIGDGDSDGRNELYVGTSNKQLYQVWLEAGIWKSASVGSGNGAINGVAVGSTTGDAQVLQLFAASADGHCYEYLQDYVAPANPEVWSDTHPVPGRWYNDRRVHMLWRDLGCDISGLDGYSTAWDGQPDTLPDIFVDLEESTHDIFTTLEDGCWYFHIRAADNVHNWNSSATHFGPVLIDTTSPDSVQLTVNGGAAFASSNLVALSICASDPSPGSGIAGMAFSNDGRNWSDWEPFCATRAGWDLTDPVFGGNASDGNRTVFARVQDGVGREVPADRRARASIFLDRSAPEGLSLSINGGAGFTSSAEVRLEVGARDPHPASGIAAMAFSNDGIDWGDWQEWSNSTGWSLAAGAGGDGKDGKKTVFFRVQDRAGNTGGAVNASIFLDRGSPGGLGITIAGGAEYTNTAEASLDLSAADPSPGSLPLEMNLASSEEALGSWEPFTAQRLRWNLTSGPGGTDTDGPKTVLLRVRDMAGNTGGPVNDTIFLDRVRPGPLKLVVNAGANWTNCPEVELSLEATDTLPASGVHQMQFSTDGVNWSAWEAYSPRKRCTLPGPDGPKTILFRVRDRAGNVAETVSASILLDATPPVISNLTAVDITNDSVTLTWTTDEPSAGLVEYGSGPVLDRNQTSDGYVRNHTVHLTGLAPSTTYRFRVRPTDEHLNSAPFTPERNFTTLETYTPPPPAPGPAPEKEKGWSWAWVAVPLLAVGAAAGLFVLGRSRRRRAQSSPSEGKDPRENGRGTPGAIRPLAVERAPPGAMGGGAVDWGTPEPAASPVLPGDEALETLRMDDDLPTATAVAVSTVGQPGLPPPPAAARPPVRTVRCTGCGTLVPVHGTSYPVRIMCSGCGKRGIYRGPRTN